MSIRIKRNAGDAAPTTLVNGQLAYAEGATNGGTLYYGMPGAVVAIGGKKYVTKIDGIEAGAQVNTVISVAGRSGDVVIVTGDLADFNSAVDARIALTPSGATAFTSLTDVPQTYTAQGNKFVRVNPGATALEFVEDIDDGFFT